MIFLFVLVVVLIMGKPDKTDKPDTPPKKEPQLVIGHPDLASGAGVQRGNKLYVSILEAIYRESRGEHVEIHFTPTDEDNAALEEMRTRIHERWKKDMRPDGWTQPLPPNRYQEKPKKQGASSASGSTGTTPLPDDLRNLAEAIKTKQGESI